jgi:membrane-bound lytic murein transglycosylase A
VKRGGAALAALALGCWLVAGCAMLRPRPRTPVVDVSAGELPALTDDLDVASLHAAVERTLPAYRRTGDAGAEAAAARLLEIVDGNADPEARRAAVAAAFRLLRVRDPLLMTAYYEPELEGRLIADAAFRYPLYARPPDLVDVDASVLGPGCRCRPSAGRLTGSRLFAFPSRGDIDAGALAGRGLELAWADDPIALFNLHVQGSGLLRLEDGRRIGVRYAGTNGRPYRSLGRVLVERGLLPRNHSTLPDIRRYLESLPDTERAALLAVNERFTFFRLADGGPIGSLGVELTPGRTIAADPRVVPPGTLGYLVTPNVRRLVVSQDAGAAVVGAHVDLFLGAGAEAEARAGRTREHGRLYLLAPR